MKTYLPELIYIYNENCIMAGSEVPLSKLAMCDDPSESCDWTNYEVSRENVDFLLASKSAFDRKCGRTLQKYFR